MLNQYYEICHKPTNFLVVYNKTKLDAMYDIPPDDYFSFPN